MKINEMRERTIEELNDEVINLRKKSYELRVALKMNKLENTAEISNTKTQISQVKTVIREKQLQLRGN